MTRTPATRHVLRPSACWKSSHAEDCKNECAEVIFSRPYGGVRIAPALPGAADRQVPASTHHALLAVNILRPRARPAPRLRLSIPALLSSRRARPFCLLAQGRLSPRFSCRYQIRASDTTCPLRQLPFSACPRVPRREFPKRLWARCRKSKSAFQKARVPHNAQSRIIPARLPAHGHASRV